MSWRERDEGERRYERDGRRSYNNPYDRYGSYDERRAHDDFDDGQRAAERRAEERRQEKEAEDRRISRLAHQAELNRQQEEQEYWEQQERESDREDERGEL
jgi:hypothetical protein